MQTTSSPTAIGNNKYNNKTMGIKVREELTRIAETLKDLNQKQAMHCLLDHRDSNYNYRKVYYSLLNVRGDWQIERLFCSYKRSKNFYEIFEVERNYLNVITLEEYHQSKARAMGYRDSFVVDSKWHWSKDSTWIAGFDVPFSKVHKAVAKRGYDKSWLGGADVMQMLLTNNLFEYLYKIRSCFASRIRTTRFDEDLLGAIKIAHRHHIPVFDATLFQDTISLMKEFKKDFRNPSVLKDWVNIHDKLAIKQADMLKRKLAKDVIERKERMSKYPKFLSQFKDLCLVTQGIKITVLQTAQEYLDEGEKQHICVGTCGYYGKENTIIMSARSPKGKRIATIEYNIAYESIIQCRGVCNGVPERYDDIVDLINKNKSYINSFIRTEVKQLKSA